MKSFSKKISKNTLLYAIIMMMAVAGEACNSEAIYDNLQKFADRGETIYPAKFDTIYGRIGYERVEIDLRKDGRIPANKMEMGRSVKTVIVFDEDTPNPVTIKFDSLCSWVNITGLTEPRLYRFKVYTEDRYGSRSIPQEISLIPYTVYDRDVLALGITEPTVSAASSALLMEWPNGLHNIMSEFHGLSYQYNDAEGESYNGSFEKDPRIYAYKLPEQQEVIFNMTYRMLPILGNGQKLLDTIDIPKPYYVQMPSSDRPFYPSELNILRGNGIQTFTLEEADKVTELIYPMNMTTFADLFYFNNVNTLNLTGKGVPGTLETLAYANFGNSGLVGGGTWQEFMMPVDQPSRLRILGQNNNGWTPLQGLQTLKDALDAGQITKIQYIPKSMGTAFDQFLQPYINAGIVELLTNDHTIFPNVVYIEPQFFLTSRIQSTAWFCDFAYSGDFLPRPGMVDITKFDPKNDMVNEQPADLKLDQLIQSDGKNIYRIAARDFRPTFVLALPRQWRFDNQKYRYLKYKMFIGCDRSLVTNVGGNNRHIYREPWNRFVNYMWTYWLGNSSYGQEAWNAPNNTPMTEAEIQTSWREYVIDCSQNDGGDTSNRRNRVYIINFGREQAVTWSYDPNNQIVVYLADIRLCKTIND